MSAGASPQTPLGELRALPQTPTGLKGAASRQEGNEGKDWEEMEGKEKGGERGNVKWAEKGEVERGNSALIVVG